MSGPSDADRLAEKANQLAAEVSDLRATIRSIRKRNSVNIAVLGKLVEVLSEMQKCRLCFPLDTAADECHAKKVIAAFEEAKALLAASEN